MPAVSKRLHIIDEIYQTETNFITDLKILNHDLIRLISVGSLTRSEKILLESYQMILDDVLKVQALPNVIKTKNDMKGLLDESKKTKDRPERELTSAEIAQLEKSASDREEKLKQDFNNSDKYFELLGLLINTQPIAFGLIKKTLKSQPSFEKKESAANIKEPIDSYLIKPVQRLVQYELLLKDLIKNTQKDLGPILNKVKEKAESINARTGESSGESIKKQRVILLDAYANMQIEKLVQNIIINANFNRVEMLEVLKKDLLGTIQKIADDKNLNSLEKLHQIKSKLEKRKYRRVIPQAARKEFEKNYNSFRPVFVKHVFTKQTATLSELRQKNKDFEKEIGKPDKNADKEKLDKQIKGYQAAIATLREQQKTRTQAAKFRRISSPAQLITRVYISRKIAEYSRSLTRLEQQVSKLEQINRRAEAPQDALPERPSQPQRPPEIPKRSEPLPPNARPDLSGVQKPPKPVPPSREGRPPLSGSKPVPPPRPSRPDLKSSHFMPPQRPRRIGGFFDKPGVDKPGATVKRGPLPPLPTKMKGPNKKGG